MIKVSIALATYNGARYLPELLDSLSHQTLMPDEIIISDDCSNDNTVQILEQYSKKLPIRIIRNKSNLGVNKNFEKAIKNCTGDYILICDQDDVWFSNNIEEKIRVLEKMPTNQPALVTTQSVVTDKKLRILQKGYASKDIDDWRFLFTKHYQGTTMAFNRKLLDVLPGHWPETFGEFPYDYCIYLTALLTGNVYASKKALMCYRTHDNNVSIKVSKIKNFIKRIFPTHKLYQDRICIRMMNNMEWLLRAIDESVIIEERKSCFLSICNCVKKLRIDWLCFLRINSLPLSIRLRSIFGSVVFFFKEL